MLIMNRKMFINDLKELIEKYKLDKIIGFKSVKLANSIWWIIYSMYELPKEGEKDELERIYY